MFKNWKKSYSVALALALGAVAATTYYFHADHNGRKIASDTTSPGYLPDYDYQVSEVSMATAQNLYNSLDRDSMKGNSICANRAHVWAYTMNRDANVYSGKLFIFFTDQTPSADEKTWWYHVTPYVMVNGEVTTLDGGRFGPSVNGPVPMNTWLNRFSHGRANECVELNARDNADLETQLRFSRQLPSIKAPCYYKKVPMYFMYPNSIAMSDIDHSVKFTEFTKGGLVQACKQAVSGGFLFKKRFCRRYLGFDD